MLNPNHSDDKSGLEKAIDTVFSEMAGVSCDSDEYAKMVDNVVKLYPLKEKDIPFLKRLSPDTIALVVGNIIVAMLIVGHERAHVVTSKAGQYLLKLR